MVFLSRDDNSFLHVGYATLIDLEYLDSLLNIKNILKTIFKNKL